MNDAELLKNFYADEAGKLFISLDAWLSLAEKLEEYATKYFLAGNMPAAQETQLKATLFKTVALEFADAYIELSKAE